MKAITWFDPATYHILNACPRFPLPKLKSDLPIPCISRARGISVGQCRQGPLGRLGRARRPYAAISLGTPLGVGTTGALALRRAEPPKKADIKPRFEMPCCFSWSPRGLGRRRSKLGQ
jgi:hypothetical protein